MTEEKRHKRGHKGGDRRHVSERDERGEKNLLKHTLLKMNVNKKNKQRKNESK